MLRRLLVLLAILHLQLRGAVSAAGNGVIRGKVLVPATFSAANAVVHLFTPEGRHLRTFCDNDGSFTLTGVPKGSHMLQADLMGLYYPEVRVDTNSKGKIVRALFLPPNAKQAVALPDPLQLRPAGEITYYEKRKPVDIWSFIKTPYGLMLVFGVFVVFVAPKLKLDPEEVSQLQGKQPDKKRMERITE